MPKGRNLVQQLSTFIGEDSYTPLRKYLDSKKESINAFARKCNLWPSTMHKIYKSAKPTRKIAKIICRNSNGELSMKDFGYE